MHVDSRQALSLSGLTFGCEQTRRWASTGLLLVEPWTRLGHLAGAGAWAVGAGGCFGLVLRKGGKHEFLSAWRIIMGFCGACSCPQTVDSTVGTPLRPVPRRLVCRLDPTTLLYMSVYCYYSPTLISQIVLSCPLI